ncbi:GNAT family N-acetyltransferase [Telluribacter sp.]|jgi:ribosomal protein S18 acetylase RimI-like enzyme|uniref:GNAT family N-acetyltransferase n=1 Tax=Telluribacter sp. TaxID=1978767 RepID=UPI002E0DB925|nr:GNAT family N-acetyltransferase [Telluribacter sp.]
MVFPKKAVDIAPHFTHAHTDQDLRQILDLQRRNLKTQISEQTKREQGFVTVSHEWAQLQLMQSLTPQIVAKAGGRVVAYALAMLPPMGGLIPDLQPMFEIIDEVEWNGKYLRDYRYYVMGQICVDEKYRGQGIFDGLYQKHKELYSAGYELLVTEISTSNPRSQRAHERVGFCTIHTHLDHVDEWNIVAWEL